ncbi:unnamed protein product, partial [Laminaria digitata]
LAPPRHRQTTTTTDDESRGSTSGRTLAEKKARPPWKTLGLPRKSNAKRRGVPSKRGGVRSPTSQLAQHPSSTSNVPSFEFWSRLQLRSATTRVTSTRGGGQREAVVIFGTDQVGQLPLLQTPDVVKFSVRPWRSRTSIVSLGSETTAGGASPPATAVTAAAPAPAAPAAPADPGVVSVR